MNALRNSGRDYDGRANGFEKMCVDDNTRTWLKASNACGCHRSPSPHSAHRLQWRGGSLRNVRVVKPVALYAARSRRLACPAVANRIVLAASSPERIDNHEHARLLITQRARAPA